MENKHIIYSNTHYSQHYENIHWATILNFKNMKVEEEEKNLLVRVLV